ncbi:MAG TPA: heavy-metal-associated domain-containing protein [Sphingomicrobium sp.]|nr:heavy-metal-associated domain-containing protein [Sphingomicrobium sp.]
MLSRRFAIPLMMLAAAGLGGALYAQLESTDRGILPLDSSNTLEIGAIHVDVGGADAETARYTGWRIAQREGFKALWAKMHNVPVAQAPTLPDSTLDQIVSSINVEREQIGPNRYIADLGVQFDRGRAAPFLGVEGAAVVHSAPMLLVPITISGGTETSVEVRNAWQRAWAQFHTAQSPIDYVRVSGMGGDPLLINASQTHRPGRGWWRNLLQMYGASDVLVAEVQLQRLYPGGPARGRFIARHGPDDEVIGGFTLTAPSSDGIPAMMAEGAQRIDQIFAQAMTAGRLNRDSSLDLPPPPTLPPLPVQEKPVASPKDTVNSYQVQVTGKNVNFYNFAMAHLHTLQGVESASPQQINPGGTSYILVRFKGTVAQLAAALGGRGWTVESAGTVIKIHSESEKPPALPPPPAPSTTATPVPQPPTQQPGQPPRADQ